MIRRARTYYPLGLVASSRRNIKPGAEYNQYFDKPQKQDPYLTYLGTTYQTLDFMAKIVSDTSNETKKLAKKLKGPSLERTIHNVWNFLFNHFQYKQDSPTTEELRSPSRSWFDRTEGIDCDCFSILAGSILHNISLLDPAHIPGGFAFRMTKYNGKSYFQHVYVVVPKRAGLTLDKRENYFVIDPVLDKPDFEKPFSEKFDKMMPIRYLNGPEDENTLLTGLDGKKKKKKGKTKVGKVLMKASKVVKKLTVGPAAIPIRNGLLLAMKINFKRMAERLGYGYFTPAEAQAKGLDIKEYEKVKKALNKTIKLFTAMEGKAANLKKAIIAGWKKGSKKRPLKPVQPQAIAGIFDFPNVLSTLFDFASTPQDNTFTSQESKILFPALGILNGLEEELGCPHESLGKLKIKAPSLKTIAKTAFAPALAPAALVSKKARTNLKNHVKVVAKAALLPAAAAIATTTPAALLVNKKTKKKILGDKKSKAAKPVQASAQAAAPAPAKKESKAKKGILSKLKKNKDNISKKLAPGFMTPAQADKAGLDPVEHQKLTEAKEQAFSMVAPHGVSHDEFKEAVDSGAEADDQMYDDQQGAEDSPEGEVEDFTEDAEELDDVAEEDAINGLFGFGEVATATGVTAASGVIASILGAMKGIDFKKLLGKKGGQFPSKEERETASSDLETGMDTYRATGENAPIVPGISNSTLLIGAALVGAYYLFNQEESAPQYAQASPIPGPIPQPAPLGGTGRRKAKSKTHNKKVQTIKI